MGKIIDLTGQVFGRLTVIGFDHRDKHRVSYWLVKCSCGVLKIVGSNSLVRGHTKSCGCLHKEVLNLSRRGVTDLTGHIFGRLTIIERAPNKGDATCWVARCSCGKIKVVRGESMKAGVTLSCGCLQKERAREAHRVDIGGNRFDRLTAIEPTDKTVCGQIMWRCLCVCGKGVLVSTTNLNRLNVRSCGCLRKERVKERCTTHGLSNLPVYYKIRNRIRRDQRILLDSQWTPLMDVCLRDYQPACVVCGSTDKLSVDHVLPLSKGNGLYPGNSVILCRRHNSMKSNKNLDQLPTEMATKIKEAAESFRVAWSGGF